MQRKMSLHKICHSKDISEAVGFAFCLPVLVIHFLLVKCIRYDALDFDDSFQRNLHFFDDNTFLLYHNLHYYYMKDAVGHNLTPSYLRNLQP